MAQQERTEKATGRRRQKAKDEGQFAYSQELTSALALIGCTVTVFYMIGSPAAFRSFLAGLLENATTADASQLIRQAGVYFLSAAAPVFITAVAAALAGNLIQGLPMFAHEKPTLNFGALNPVKGLSRLKAQLSWIQWL